MRGIERLPLWFIDGMAEYLSIGPTSIQFIYSAGGWDSTSRRFAAATVVSGRPAIAIFDGLSGEREREFAVADVDEVLNPTWSPDGHAIAFATDRYTSQSADSRTLYFISDENGISNLARVGADGSEPARLTNVATGISGITSTSPALSVAQGAGMAAFSVYDRGKCDIYTGHCLRSRHCQRSVR